MSSNISPNRETEPLLQQAEPDTPGLYPQTAALFRESDDEINTINSINSASETEIKPEQIKDRSISSSSLPERDLENPTSNLVTFIHLLKANIGTGLQAMPDAIQNSGLAFGTAGIVFMGVICIHCMHLLVWCSRVLSYRTSAPSLDYATVMEKAFETGPRRTRSFSKLARGTTQLFLCVTQLGFCCVYIVYCAANFKQVFDCYFPSYRLSVHVYMVIMLPAFCALGCIRNLKGLGPCSNTANALMAFGIVLIFRYLLVGLPDVRERTMVAPVSDWPLFFGTAMYAFEGIGVVLPLENNMQSPDDFGGWNGVLNTGMVIVVCMYVSMGFYGYLRYGDDVRGSITLNLPPGDQLVRVIQISMSIAIFLSYGLQFYVPVKIMWPHLKSRINDSRRHKLYEFLFRLALVFLTFLLAVIIPNIGLFISLVGAFSSTFLALICPPIIQTLTLWPCDLGFGYWILWKNVVIVLFGLAGFAAGTHASIRELVIFFQNGGHSSIVTICE